MVEGQNISEAMDEVKRISIESIDSLLAFMKGQKLDYLVYMSALISIGTNILKIPLQSINSMDILQALKKEILETIVSLFDEAEEKLKQKMN